MIFFTFHLQIRKALAYFGIVLFLCDTGSDFYVGIDLIKRCHYRYATSVLSFFWLPGLLSGGVLAVFFDEKILGKKYDINLNCCGETGTDVFIFFLGTMSGPLVFIPGGLYLLIKAASNMDDEEVVGLAKL